MCGDSLMDPDNIPEGLNEQTREEKYCEEHDLIYVKNAMGVFICPFCRANVDC